LSSLFGFELAFGSLLAKGGRRVFLAELFSIVFSVCPRARLRLTLGQSGEVSFWWSYFCLSSLFFRVLAFGSLLAKGGEICFFVEWLLIRAV